MSNELIKKAYEHFDGVWPYGALSVMLFNSNAFLFVRAVRILPDASRENMERHLADEWQWVGTKSDFDAYGESLKVPEGATHKIKRKGKSDVFLKDLDPQAMRYSVWDVNGWVDNVDWFVGDNIEKIEIADKAVEEEWMPEIGQECEYLFGGESIVGFIQAVDGDAIWFKKRDGVFKTFLGKHKFRPLKTEAEKQADEMFDIVKDATDVYHACELLVKEGFKKCAA